MSVVEVTLLLLGAFWAGTSALFSGVTYVTQARDKILLGKSDQTRLSKQHRKRILYADWLPMRLALAGVSLVLAVIIFSLPSITEKPELSGIALVTGIVPVCGFLNFLVVGVFEFLSMARLCRQLSDHPEPSTTEASSEDTVVVGISAD